MSGDTKVPIALRIMTHLMDSPGCSAAEIARTLGGGIRRSDINSILYGRPAFFRKGSGIPVLWYLTTQAEREVPTRTDRAVPSGKTPMRPELFVFKGQHIVIDPRLIPPGSDVGEVWFRMHGYSSPYPLVELEQHAKPLALPAVEEKEVLTAYGAWFNKMRSSGQLAGLHERCRMRSAGAARIWTNMLKKHEEYVRSMGKTFHGTKMALAEHEDQCHTCGASVDSDRNPACQGCGWLVCRCGACGCGYRGPFRRKSTALTFVVERSRP